MSSNKHNPRCKKRTARSEKHHGSLKPLQKLKPLIFNPPPSTPCPFPPEFKSNIILTEIFSFTVLIISRKVLSDIGIALSQKNFETIHNYSVKNFTMNKQRNDYKNEVFWHLLIQRIFSI